MTDDQMAPASSETAPRKLTHLQARAEQRLYWSRKSPAERLAAATALTKRSYSMLGIDLAEPRPDERKADLTPRRVRRRQG
jgi:PIN domain nuclease of toxin-antitoxin system